jgi:hypothetical protein
MLVITAHTSLVTCITLVGLSKKSPWIFGHLHLRSSLHLVYTPCIGGLSVWNDSIRSVPSSPAPFWTRYRPFVSVHTLRCAPVLALVEGFKITGISSHRPPTKLSYSTLSDICYVRWLKVKLSLGLIKHHPENTHGGMEVYSIHSQPRHTNVASFHLKSLNVEIRACVGHGLTVRILFEALNCSVSARHVSVFLTHSIRQRLCVCVCVQRRHDVKEVSEAAFWYYTCDNRSHVSAPSLSSKLSYVFKIWRLNSSKRETLI